jgi:HK97 family phage major capsid protein
VFIQLKTPYFGKPAGERVDVDDKHARTLIDQGVAEAVTGNPIGELVEKQMGVMLESLTRNLNDTITETIKKVAAAQTRSHKNAVPALFGEGGQGDPQRCFGDWCLQVAILGSQKTSPAAKTTAADKLDKVYRSPRHDWAPDTEAQFKAALGESSGVTGGYIVPPDFYEQLLSIAAEEATFRQQAFVMPMASATLQFPYLDITTVQSAGNTPFFGGVIANWTSEAQTRTETEPKFKMMELKAQELSGYSVSSNILLQDAAFGLEKFLFTLFGKACAWYEEYAFLQGNGVGKPLGILNAGATIKTGGTSGHRDSGLGVAGISFADISTMLSKFLPGSIVAGKGCWYFSPTCLPYLLQLKDGANRALFVSIDQGAVKKPVWKLFGLPAILTEKLPACGTVGDLILVDPSLYVIGDRMMLEIAASEHVNFLANQMTWRFVQRVDGRPWLENAITLQDASSTVSPFVILN